MADLQGALGGDGAVAFLVSAGLVYEVIAAACSSPQTTEINAGKRADTLMKWVHLGMVQSAILIGVGAYLSRSPKAVIAGGVTAGAFMYGSYVHAKAAGLASDAPGTEQY